MHKLKLYYYKYIDYDINFKPDNDIHIDIENQNKYNINT